MLIKLSLRWAVVAAMALVGAGCLVYGIVWLLRKFPEDPNDSPTLAFGMAFIFAGSALLVKATKLFGPLKEMSLRKYRLLAAVRDSQFD